MFVGTKKGCKTAAITVAIASLLVSTSVLAGRATGLPHYQDNVTAISPTPNVAPASSRLSSAERIARLEDEILALKTCLKNMVELRAFRCVL